MPNAIISFSGSLSHLGELLVTGSINAPNITGSLEGTASWAEEAISSSHALLADGLNATSLTLADLTITNTASIQYLDVVYQSSSVIYSSGSNIFGDSPSDVQTLHGTVVIVNDAQITGSLKVDGGITGSLLGTASFANNSDNALTASYVESAQSASYFITSSVTSASLAQTASMALSFITSSVTSASYSETASLALNFITSSVTSASYALSASHLIGAKDVGFQKEWHVSAQSGSDVTGNGSLSKPYATLGKAFASVGGTGEQIVMHPGLYLEATATLTQPNITIAAANSNAGGIVYMNGTITIAPGSSSTRINGILFNNLIHSGSSGLYLDTVQVKANYTKIGTGYSEITNTDLQASGSIVFKGGTTVIQGDKQGLVQASGSGTAVYIKDSAQVVSPSAVAGAILVVDSSQVYPLASGSAAITAAAGTTVYLYNTRITTATGIPERINVSGFLGYDDVQFNKNLSTLGTPLNLRAHFQQIDTNALTATGSLFGTASWALNASVSNTASFAQTASYVETARTASYFLTSSVTNATFAQSASYFSGSNAVVGNLVVNGTASINYLDVRFESASVIYSSGSNQFGDAPDDVQTLNGQVNINNSAAISGSLIVLGGITGSLLGTASYANNAATASTLVNGADITVGDLNISGILSFTNDTEAAAGGIPLNGVYRSGNFLLIRIS